jgi:hypothetical protein
MVVKCKIGGSWSQANLGKKQDPISKITRVKMARGVPQATEYLSSKNEAEFKPQY